MGKLVVVDHPLVQHKLSLIRDKQTGAKEFRELVEEVAMLMCYEVTRDLPLKEIEVETPVSRAKTKVIVGKKVAFVPILRAGLGMVDGMLKLVPAAKVGHIGIYREPETEEIVVYYCKLPEDSTEREIILIDPMIASGRSISAAVDLLNEKGCHHIKVVSLLATQAGIDLLQKNHPEVEIITCSIDEGVNANGYIVPGLGDAGDRIFGTK